MLGGVTWFIKNRPGAESSSAVRPDFPPSQVRSSTNSSRRAARGIKGFTTILSPVPGWKGDSPLRRTYSRYGDIEAAGGDMVIARLDVAERNRPLLESVMAARKKPRVASVVGNTNANQVSVRSPDHRQMPTTPRHAFWPWVKIILDGPPELATDADKPFQYRYAGGGIRRWPKGFMTNKFIAIEGVIGVGKTTLARICSHDTTPASCSEVVEDNPFLSKFYQDRERYAFQTRYFFLLSRYHQQYQAIPAALRRGNLISDYTFAKDELFAWLNLKDDVWRCMAVFMPR